MTKLIVFFTHLHTIPHNDSDNMFLVIFANFVKNLIQKYLIYLSINIQYFIEAHLAAITALNLSE